MADDPGGDFELVDASPPPEPGTPPGTGDSAPFDLFEAMTGKALPLSVGAFSSSSSTGDPSPPSASTVRESESDGSADAGDAVPAPPSSFKTGVAGDASIQASTIISIFQEFRTQYLSTYLH